MAIPTITQMFIASTLGGSVGYTVLFLGLLKIKSLRHPADSESEDLLDFVVVMLGTLVGVETVMGIIFRSIDGTLAGRFFYIATIIGVPLIFLSAVMAIVKLPKRLRRYYYGAGLVIGNAVAALANFAVFYSNLPSL